ncbi:phosphoribosylanthranilate isomerase [Wukongibacter sp. M2B1]|uniref:phosphoribosylanthranilate isomerase n=1 Tax=Wukongibacter sp. M2B1 TaxID=3088895 RepID=UPI003D7AAC4B
MTKVKVCGLKRKEDIFYANELKPDYVGFVFAKSKRQIDMYKAKKLIDYLDSSIKTVGVFLNTPIYKVKEISSFCNLDILQLHGDETPEYCSVFDKELWKAFRVKNRDSLKELDQYYTNGYLLDTYVKGTYGGTGEAFNWDLASEVSKKKFIILAGGLLEDNIDMAIDSVKPNIVDVSSGVETNGFKDFSKMKKFIERVRKII